MKQAYEANGVRTAKYRKVYFNEDVNEKIRGAGISADCEDRGFLREAAGSQESTARTGWGGGS